jgi:hypothetical protein
MGKDVEKKSVSNQLLLRYANLSLNEIAQRTGFTPIEAGQRIAQLLDDRDWLSMRQKELLLISQLEEIIDDSRDRLSATDDEHYAAMANVVLRGMKEVGNRMSEMRKMINIDINEITAAHARIFGNAFDVATDYMTDAILEMDHTPTDAEIRELKREGMLLAKERLEQYLAEE